MTRLRGSTAPRASSARAPWVRRLLVALALAVLSAPLRSAAAPLPEPAGAEPVRQLTITRQGVAGADPARVLRVRFAAFDRDFELLLVAVDGRGGPYYRGRVRHHPGSWAWVAVRGGALDGLIQADELFGVAPAGRFGRTDVASGTLAYRVAAVAAPARAAADGGDATPASATAPATTLPGAAALAAPATASVGSAASAAAVAPSGGAAQWLAAAQAVTINKAALAALGQQDLVSNILNQPTAEGLFFPGDLARDLSVAQTRLFVADTLNSRVLGFECAGAGCALPTAAAAARVYGQADFASFQQNGGLLGVVGPETMNAPQGVAVAPDGRLVVADTGNNRVLVFDTPWDDPAADAAIGQTTLSGNAAGSGLNQLRAPQGVFVDAGGALWVADTGNNRVLKFTTLATGASAALSIGSGGGASSTTLSSPRDVFLDAGGDLWVADTGFSRVLRYAAPITNGEPAATVFGHGGSFTNGSANQGGVSANSLSQPEKLHVDGAGRLWVADTGNNRVLGYDPPFSNQTADWVIGQADASQVPSFTTNGHDAPGLPNAGGMWKPKGMDFDAAGRLWLCDRNNSRILGYDAPSGALPASIIADRVLGKSSFVDASVNTPSAARLNNPTGLAVDGSQSPNRLWVVDIGNNRVLGYDSTADVMNNRAADRVLGQPSFESGATNAGINGPLQNVSNSVGSAASFLFPNGVAVDSLGGVYVADSSNSRILHFEDPFATDTTADRVFGQTDFSKRNPSFPWGAANSVAGPTAVAIGAGDALWVADTLDNRVVRFANAPNAATTNAAADLVIGQAGFVSSSTFPPYAAGCSADRMNGPRGIHAGASGRLYVADSLNNRVLVFAPPFSNGMSASAVIGQAGFTSCAANRGGSAGAATLREPHGVYEDADGNVFVADYGNNRVLVYHLPFAGGDLVADDVIGQPTLGDTAVLSPRPDGLSSPSDVAMDAQGRLFVADREHSRVTRYATNSPPVVQLDPMQAPLVVGAFNVLTGSGFTAGSVVQLYVATSAGVVSYGPYTPNPWSSGVLYVNVPPTIGLGRGFVSVQVINTDQGYIRSNTVQQLLYGSASWNIPTISAINGVALRPADQRIPLANVETVVGQGTTVTIEGSGFNNPRVNIFTAGGNVGPQLPVGAWSSTRFDIVIPAGAPTGPGSFQIVNAPYSGNVVSNAVSVPIGERLDISAVSQSGNVVTVTGAGFSSLSVINFFAPTASGGANLGGLGASGARIPLTVQSSNQLSFTVPAAAVSGPAYVMVLNPPFIPYASTTGDPQGGFQLVVP